MKVKYVDTVFEVIDKIIDDATNNGKTVLRISLCKKRWKEYVDEFGDLGGGLKEWIYRDVRIVESPEGVGVTFVNYDRSILDDIDKARDEDKDITWIELDSDEWKEFIAVSDATERGIAKTTVSDLIGDSDVNIAIYNGVLIWSYV